MKEPEVVKVLQKLAKYNYNSDDEDSELDDNLGNLKAEAQMPIEEVMAKYALSRIQDEKKSSNFIAENSSENVSPSDSKNVFKCSEVKPNETECSSSKPNVTFNESDSEVSSSSSSCTVSRKSLSEKYNTNGKAHKTLLDSTSNGSDELSVSASSHFDSKNLSGSSCSSVVSDNTVVKSKTPALESDPAETSKYSEIERTKSSCNGKIGDIQVEEAISSSVENGELDVVKSSGKGKALIKGSPKVKEKKESESPEKLFQKFINSGMFDAITWKQIR